MSNKTRVLLVDDEAAILRFLKPELAENGYDILITGTVADAIKRIASETPDIVVLDLGLPDGDGKDVITQVRKWSNVPIVVLSARDRVAEKIAPPMADDDFEDGNTVDDEELGTVIPFGVFDAHAEAQRWP